MGTAGSIGGGWPPGFAFAMFHVTVPCRCSCELGPAARTVSFRSASRLFSLVPQEIAEGRELPSIAAVVPALWLVAGRSINNNGFPVG